jgi:ABC-type transport system involved in multi-copper enzyme maturation permease subunit/regulation of enolase protein 1 (concanavalin A-like superfamily)
MSFLRLIHAEWTKFRTVRGWLVGLVAAAFVLIAVGLISAEGSRMKAVGPGGGPRQVLTGPGGEQVQDDFTFMHRTLDGDGSLTVHVGPLAGGDSALNPWAKAGILVKKGTTLGSTYAAVMTTGGHGTRLQYDFTGDIAGPSGARWLRLVRAGSTITGYVSGDGTAWTRVGSTRLTGLPATAEIGMFVTSPADQTYSEKFGGGHGDASRTSATAVFSDVSLQSSASGGDWQQDEVGGNPGDVRAGDGTFTLTGSGNIAPAVADGPGVIERTLVGTFAGVTVLIVLGALFVTSEYRRRMIGTTFAASPHRGRVLAAKAIVLGGVAFVTGLAASAVVLPWAKHILVRNGAFFPPVSVGTEARMLLGTAAVVAVAAVFALALGTLLRRSAGAIAGAVVLIVLPYLLATATVVPAGPGNWLLRLTPAAAFAVQQTIPVYRQVDAVRTPGLGYFPLSPWAGFAVLCAYAAVAFGLAVYAVRRRDA